MAPTLHHDFADAFPELSTPTHPEVGADVADTSIVILNEPLAADLGLDPEWLRTDEGRGFLLGHTTNPVAMIYAGHQFGHYNPLMGDGRAMLLGELNTWDRVVDLHLKGSGRTPLSRPGSDGRATLAAMVREYVVSEAMHALGVPTTRALAVIATGERIQRTRVEPGAVLVRVADSHMRVGTFQYAAARDAQRGGDNLQRLADFAITRHRSTLATAEGDYLGFFRAVAMAQARLIGQWLRFSFVHGVMNTDNMAISGETIDYGPCAFLDRYEPDKHFSSIDTDGRYRFSHQPGVMGWNLARFAESLLPLLTTSAAAESVIEELTEIINTAVTTARNTHLRLIAEALGSASSDGTDAPDIAKAQRFLDHCAEHRLDHTAELAAVSRGVASPLYVPRNHALQRALDAATDGDLAPVERILDAVTHPYRPLDGDDTDLRFAPPEGKDRFVSYCGT